MSWQDDLKAAIAETRRDEWQSDGVVASKRFAVKLGALPVIPEQRMLAFLGCANSVPVAGMEAGSVLFSGFSIALHGETTLEFSVRRKVEWNCFLIHRDGETRYEEFVGMDGSRPYMTRDLNEIQ